MEDEVKKHGRPYRAGGPTKTLGLRLAPHELAALESIRNDLGDGTTMADAVRYCLNRVFAEGPAREGR